MLFESPLKLKEHRTEAGPPRCTDEFSYVLLTEIALVIVTIFDKKANRTGYMRDISSGIQQNLEDIKALQI